MTDPDPPRRIENICKFLLMLLAGIWIGFLIGLSFVETPLKFQAPGITKELALGIGRLVFSTLNKIEIAFCAVLLVCWLIRLKEFRRWYSVVPILIIAIVALQTFHLLPALQDRTDQIIAGGTPEKSHHHWMYMVVELLKIPSLILVFWFAYGLRGCQQPHTTAKS